MYLFIRFNTPAGEKIIIIPDKRLYSIVRSNAQIEIRYDNCSSTIEGNESSICAIPKADTVKIPYPSVKIADSVLSQFFKALEADKKTFSFTYDKICKKSGDDNYEKTT